MMLYLVAGSQASTGRQNHVTLVKMSQLVKTHKEENPNDNDDDSKSHDISILCKTTYTEGSDDSDTDDDEDEPVLDTINVMHDGGVNRIRVCIFSKV